MNLIDWRRRLAWNGLPVTLLGLSLALTTGIVLLRLSPLEGAAFVGLAAVFIGALIEPFVALAAGLFLGPLKAYVSAEVPQVPPQIGHVFIALALASWLMKGLSKREVRVPGLRGSPVPILLPLLAFLAVALLSLWDAIGLLTYGLPELIKWVEMVLLVVLVQQHLTSSDVDSIGDSAFEDARRSRRRLKWLVGVLLGGGLFQALIGLWQFGLRGEGPEHFRILGGEFFRAYGTFEQPNPYAGYLGLTAALALGTVATLVWDHLLGERRRSAGAEGTGRVPVPARQLDWGFVAFGAGCCGAMLIALVASWSRGGWMGFGAATLVMAVALPRKRVGSILLVLILVVAGLGVYGSGLLPGSFVDRMTSFARDIRLEDVRGMPINDANFAVIERLAHWQAALSMTRYDLWTGIGLGCYEAAYPMFALINWPIALGHAHNIYLNLLAETGLTGLVVYLILWGVTFWRTWVVTRRAQGLRRAVGVGLLGAWAHLTAHHLLDNLYVNNVHLHLGVLLGLAAFLDRRTHGKSSTDDR